MRPILLALALIASTGCHAQGPDPCATAPASCATLINTHATATMRLPNTAVDISVTIQVSGRDLITVQHALAAKSEALISYLRAQKTERLITTNVSFSPDSREQKNAPNKIVGYDASSSVSFRTTPDHAPELLGAVLDHGASSVDSVSFTPTEEEIARAREDLSGQATKLAIAQAGSVAAAAGLHVAAVRSVDVEASNSFTLREPMTSFAMKVAPITAAAPVAAAAGDAALSVTVNVTAAATH